MRSRPTQDCAYSPGGLGGTAFVRAFAVDRHERIDAAGRERDDARSGNACATSAGTWAFIAQVSDRSPSAPNLRPAMKMMFGACGSAAMAASSSRSQLMVSMPRACSQSLTLASLKRATPIMRRPGRAALASPASVGPILPATPKIMMSPSTLARSSISAWLGRHNRSSSAAISAIVSGRVSRVSSMFRPCYYCSRTSRTTNSRSRPSTRP